MRLYASFNSRSLGGYDLIDADSDEGRRYGEITWAGNRMYQSFDLSGNPVVPLTEGRDVVVALHEAYIQESQTEIHKPDDGVRRKHCSWCTRALPLVEFPLQSGSVDGRDSMCHRCLGHTSKASWQAKREQAALDLEFEEKIR